MTNASGWDWGKALLAMPERWTEVAEEMFSFVHELKKNNCKSVYDLGCGVGRHTAFLAQQGFQVTASDVSPSAVEKTQQLLKAENLNASIQNLDMHEWPFADNSFDAIVAFNVVYHTTVNQLENILAEINRCLSDGGLLLVTFKSTLDSEYGQGEKLSDYTYAPTSGIEQGIAHYYLDENELKRLMQTFELVSLVHKQEHPVSSKSERLRAHWLVWAKKTQTELM